MFRFGFRRRRATKTYQVTVLDGSTLTFELEVRDRAGREGEVGTSNLCCRRRGLLARSC